MMECSFAQSHRRAAVPSRISDMASENNIIFSPKSRIRRISLGLRRRRRPGISVLLHTPTSLGVVATLRRTWLTFRLRGLGDLLCMSIRSLLCSVLFARWAWASPLSFIWIPFV